MANIALNSTRRTGLFSRHGFLLEVTKDSVQGTVAPNESTTLLMHSVDIGEIVLQGERAETFIAMNQEGNLFATPSLTEECIFKESHDANGYNSYASKRHPSWFLALTDSGLPKPGPKTAFGQRAVMFIPTGVEQS